MTVQRFVAGTLVAVMALGSTPAFAARQAPGVIAGKATDEAKQPYSDYAVQLRDVATGLVISTTPLDVKGEFSFTGVPIARYLVELPSQEVGVALVSGERCGVASGLREE